MAPTSVVGKIFLGKKISADRFCYSKLLKSCGFNQTVKQNFPKYS